MYVQKPPPKQGHLHIIMDTSWGPNGVLSKKVPLRCITMSYKNYRAALFITRRGRAGPDCPADSVCLYYEQQQGKLYKWKVQSLGVRLHYVVPDILEGTMKVSQVTVDSHLQLQANMPDSTACDSNSLYTTHDGHGCS